MSRLEDHQRAQHLSPLPLHIMTARGGPQFNLILMHNLMIILQLNCPRCILVCARFKCPRRLPLTFPLLYNWLTIDINIAQHFIAILTLLLNSLFPKYHPISAWFTQTHFTQTTHVVILIAFRVDRDWAFAVILRRMPASRCHILSIVCGIRIIIIIQEYQRLTS